jgi:hypothetical protein
MSLETTYPQDVSMKSKNSDTFCGRVTRDDSNWRPVSVSFPSQNQTT